MLDFVLLIPCYNNQKGLLASLKSISYYPGKFEILIIDDGSIIPLSEKELQSQCRNARVQVIRIQQNAGIVKALNTGLKALKPRNDISYIARLDAGDICNSQRFYKQVDFLNTNKEVALLASWARFEDIHTNKGYDYITQTTHEAILREMHYKCSFIHPSVIFRKTILNEIGLYPEMYPHAEDYAYFWKILNQYEGAVLPEKLVKIIYSEDTVSNENYKTQLYSRKKIVRDFSNRFLDRQIGIAMLNLKLMMPRALIQFLKKRT